MKKGGFKISETDWMKELRKARSEGDEITRRLILSGLFDNMYEIKVFKEEYGVVGLGFVALAQRNRKIDYSMINKLIPPEADEKLKGRIRKKKDKNE